jgi:hypothetical protein
MSQTNTVPKPASADGQPSRSTICRHAIGAWELTGGTGINPDRGS